MFQQMGILASLRASVQSLSPSGKGELGLTTPTTPSHA